MTTKQTGGPAFPSEQYNAFDDAAKGMTLRDYFAAKAMQAIVTKAGYVMGEVDLAAEFAYDLADAMLAERSK